MALPEYLQRAHNNHLQKRTEENEWLGMSDKATKALSSIDALVAVTFAATEADKMTPKLERTIQLRAAIIREGKPWVEVSGRINELYLKNNISKQNGARV